ncbi:MAG TPA: hypothetical protein DEF85_01350 [Clostridiaceae bacterium]|nr:hypothetical protein [Bacteroidales bacterium]HBX47526.1 hypothetical protein [Clostridiaceae bacterium]
MINFKIIIRYFILVAGLFLMGLGVDLITKSNLVTSPISSVPYVLSMIFPFTFGETTFLISFLFILFEIMILKKDFPKEHFLQVLVCPIFGFFIDFGMNIFAFVNYKFYSEQIILLLLGCILLALGVRLEFLANVIIYPADSLVKTIANKTKKEFGNIKIMFDCTLVLTAVVISLLAFKNINGLGEGTIISALLVGYITKIISTVFKYFNIGKLFAN